MFGSPRAEQHPPYLETKSSKPVTREELDRDPELRDSIHRYVESIRRHENGTGSDERDLRWNELSRQIATSIYTTQIGRNFSREDVYAFIEKQLQGTLKKRERTVQIFNASEVSLAGLNEVDERLGKIVAQVIQYRREGDKVSERESMDSLEELLSDLEENGAISDAGRARALITNLIKFEAKKKKIPEKVVRNALVATVDIAKMDLKNLGMAYPSLKRRVKNILESQRGGGTEIAAWDSLFQELDDLVKEGRLDPEKRKELEDALIDFIEKETPDWRKIPAEDLTRPEDFLGGHKGALLKSKQEFSIQDITDINEIDERLGSTTQNILKHRAARNMGENDALDVDAEIRSWRFLDSVIEDLVSRGVILVSIEQARSAITTFIEEETTRVRGEDKSQRVDEKMGQEGDSSEFTVRNFEDLEAIDVRLSATARNILKHRAARNMGENDRLDVDAEIQSWRFLGSVINDLVNRGVISISADQAQSIIADFIDTEIQKNKKDSADVVLSSSSLQGPPKKPEGPQEDKEGDMLRQLTKELDDARLAFVARGDKDRYDRALNEYNRAVAILYNEAVQDEDYQSRGVDANGNPLESFAEYAFEQQMRANEILEQAKIRELRTQVQVEQSPLWEGAKKWVLDRVDTYRKQPMWKKILLGTGFVAAGAVAGVLGGVGAVAGATITGFGLKALSFASSSLGFKMGFDAKAAQVYGRGDERRIGDARNLFRANVAETNPNRRMLNIASLLKQSSDDVTRRAQKRRMEGRLRNLGAMGLGAGIMFLSSWAGHALADSLGFGGPSSVPGGGGGSMPPTPGLMPTPPGGGAGGHYIDPSQYHFRWMDNNTPAPRFDGTELQAHYGGNHWSGVGSDGGTVMQLTPSGDAHHGAIHHALAQHIRNGEASALITANGHSIEVPVDASGNFHLPPGSDADKLFTHVGNKTIFHGDRIEWLVPGQGDHGKDIVATVLGKHDGVLPGPGVTPGIPPIPGAVPEPGLESTLWPWLVPAAAIPLLWRRRRKRNVAKNTTPSPRPNLGGGSGRVENIVPIPISQEKEDEPKGSSGGTSQPLAEVVPFNRKSGGKEQTPGSSTKGVKQERSVKIKKERSPEVKNAEKVMKLETYKQHFSELEAMADNPLQNPDLQKKYQRRLAFIRRLRRMSVDYIAKGIPGEGESSEKKIKNFQKGSVTMAGEKKTRKYVYDLDDADPAVKPVTEAFERLQSNILKIYENCGIGRAEAEELIKPIDKEDILKYIDRVSTQLAMVREYDKKARSGQSSEDSKGVAKDEEKPEEPAQGSPRQRPRRAGRGANLGTGSADSLKKAA